MSPKTVPKMQKKAALALSSEVLERTIWQIISLKKLVGIPFKWMVKPTYMYLYISFLSGGYVSTFQRRQKLLIRFWLGVDWRVMVIMNGGLLNSNRMASLIRCSNSEKKAANSTMLFVRTNTIFPESHVWCNCSHSCW